MIALDLDNTIICYDAAFRAAAEEADCLPPNDSLVNKESVKAAAIAKGGNELWTRLQGIAYGSGIGTAKLFPRCEAFINRALDRGEKLTILSHKTEFPAAGPRINLRMAAINWLGNNRLNFGDRLPVIFCDSREDKVQYLKTLACRALVDDLPAVFQTPGFPSATHFVLFDPTNAHPEWNRSSKVSSWDEARDLLFPSDPNGI